MDDKLEWTTTFSIYFSNGQGIISLQKTCPGAIFPPKASVICTEVELPVNLWGLPCDAHIVETVETMIHSRRVLVDTKPHVVPFAADILKEVVNTFRAFGWTEGKCRANA